MKLPHEHVREGEREGKGCAWPLVDEGARSAAELERAVSRGFTVAPNLCILLVEPLAPDLPVHVGWLTGAVYIQGISCLMDV